MIPKYEDSWNIISYKISNRKFNQLMPISQKKTPKLPINEERKNSIISQRKMWEMKYIGRDGNAQTHEFEKKR